MIKTPKRSVWAVFMEIAAYVTIAGAGLSLLRPGNGVSAVFGSKEIAAEVLLGFFALALPIFSRPWARTLLRLLVWIIVEFCVVVAIFFLLGPHIVPAVLFFVLLPLGIRLPAIQRGLLYLSVLLAVSIGFAAGGLLLNWQSYVSILSGLAAMMAFSERFRHMRDTNQESSKLLDELIGAQERIREFAVHEERHRLAQEMHDLVGHRLTVAAVQLEVLSRIVRSDQDKAEKLALSSREQVREALNELRVAVRSLSNDNGDTKKLSDRIRHTADAFGLASGIPVSVTLAPGIDFLDPGRSVAVLRCVQEGLTNIQRHSGAGTATVTADILDNELRLEIRDDGAGRNDERAEAHSSQAPGGFGLKSLADRAAAWGGDLDFASDDTGASLLLRLPLENP